MAKLDRLPDKAIIMGLAGVLDFYVSGGQALVRRWPRKWEGEPTREATCNQQRFRTFQKGLKAWTRPIKVLHKYGVKKSHWRWLDYGYKCYQGEVPYAPRYVEPGLWRPGKPCPDDGQQWFLVHNCYLECNRLSDYPHEPPWHPPYHRYANYIVFWIDQGNYLLDLHWSDRRPFFRAHYRTQRGVRKFCGAEPSAIVNERVMQLDSSHYGDTPWMTHTVVLSEHQPISIADEVWGYLTTSETPRGSWPGVKGYSVSPFFHFKWPGTPSMDVGERQFHHIDPLETVRYKTYRKEKEGIPWGWMTWNVPWRSEFWPSFDWDWPEDFRYRAEPWFKGPVA